MEHDRMLENDGMPPAPKFHLLYTPKCFQDPFQLLHLKNTWYFHLHSSYCNHIGLLGSSKVNSLTKHCAVIGMSYAPESFCPSGLDDFHQNWHCSLLSSLLGIPSQCPFPCLPQHCDSKEIHLLDKLDLIEHLNHPLALNRVQLQSVIAEDLNDIEQNTRMFELEFGDFIQKLESSSSQFDMVISSLICNTTSPPISFSAATQVLRQHVYWISHDVLAALISITGAKSLPLVDRNGAIAIQFQPGMQQIVLYAGVIYPLSLLQWYEHQRAHAVFPMEVVSSKSAASNAHHWTLDCCRYCSWNCNRSTM